MSESDPPGSQLSNNSPSPGRLLREAREARGIDMVDFAATIKVPQPKLEMLEADDWAALPSIAFARALALTVCRELSVDPAPVMSLLPLTQAQRIEQVPEGLNQPHRDRSLGLPLGALGSFNRPLIWLSLLLLLAAYGIYKIPFSDSAPQAPLAANSSAASEVIVAQPPSDPASVPQEPTAEPGGMPQALPLEPVSAAQPPETPPSEVQPAVTPQSAVLHSPALQPVIQPPADQPSAARSSRLQEVPAQKLPVRPSPSPQRSAVEPSTKSVAQGAAKANSSDPIGELVASLEERRDPARRLELRATSPSWVGVYDAHDKLLFNQVLRPGSVSVVQGGALPLRLRIGNARATVVKFRGRVVDLAPSTKDNVARLHLN